MQSQDEYTTDNLQELLIILHPVFSKWYYIGLGLRVENLNVIRADYPGDAQRCFTEMLETRLRQGPLSKSELLDCLCLPTVGEIDLASRIPGLIRIPDEIELISVTKNNVIHCIKPDIADTVFPYTQLRKNYNFTAFFFVIFIFLQLVTMVDNHNWVKPRNYTVQQYTNRVVFFTLYTFLLVVTPCVCYAQLCRLGSFEKTFFISNDTTRVPIDNTTKGNVDKIVTDRKISLNPLELISQIVLLLKVKINEFDLKRFQVLIHAIILPMFLFYIRAFDDSKSHQTGWKNLRIGGERLIDLWECISFSIIFFLSGTMKDVYCFENHIATLFAEDELEQSAQRKRLSKKIFHAIRRRWSLMDVYTHFLSIVFAALAIVLFLYGKPFTPRYILLENALEQHAWNVVTVLIILLQFGGSSANPTFKLFCSICYIAFPFIMCTLVYVDEINKAFDIHLPRGNALLLIFASQLVTLINWLVCLFHCYLRQKDLHWRYHLCLAAVVLVFGCLCYINVREFKYYIHEGNCTCSCNCTSIDGSVYNMIN